MTISGNQHWARVARSRVASVEGWSRAPGGRLSATTNGRQAVCVGPKHRFVPPVAESVWCQVQAVPSISPVWQSLISVFNDTPVRAYQTDQIEGTSVLSRHRVSGLGCCFFLSFIPFIAPLRGCAFLCLPFGIKGLLILSRSLWRRLPGACSTVFFLRAFGRLWMFALFLWIGIRGKLCLSFGHCPQPRFFFGVLLLPSRVKMCCRLCPNLVSLLHVSYFRSG